MIQLPHYTRFDGVEQYESNFLGRKSTDLLDILLDEIKADMVEWIRCSPRHIMSQKRRKEVLTDGTTAFPQNPLPSDPSEGEVS